MASKKQILNRLRILITQKFDSPETAFQFFDKDEDGYLSGEELKKLIIEADVSKFLSGLVSSKLINDLDENRDKHFNWQEFRTAVKKLMKEGQN